VSPALTLLNSQFDDLLDTINNIFVSAGDGDLAKVQSFVAGGVSVNAQDEFGYAPLCVSPAARWTLAAPCCLSPTP